MSVGAVIENMVIAASHVGRRADVRLCESVQEDSASEPLPVAELQFLGETDPDPLNDYLATRCTNRKLYSKRSVDGPTLEYLAEELRSFSEVRLDWIIDRSRIKQFAKLVMKSDRYRFEYEPFHAEIFRQLRFTRQEVEQTRDGLDVRTLELPPGGASMISMLGTWKRMQWVNRLGLGRALTIPSWLSVRRSGFLGVLSIPHPCQQLFVESGRALQRLWLALDAKDLGMCPLGSLPVFIAHMEQLNGTKLHQRHQQLSVQLKERLHQLVPATRDRTLTMLLRAGHTKRPEIQSLRRPVVGEAVH
jgi:hypothetical protein